MQEGSFKSVLSLFVSRKKLEIKKYMNKDVNATKKIKELESIILIDKIFELFVI